MIYSRLQLLLDVAIQSASLGITDSSSLPDANEGLQSRVNTALQIRRNGQAELGWNHEPSALVPAGTCVLFCAFHSLYIIGGFIYV